eukprot:SAG11_NODE_9548_length_901_cov_1.415212_1_plen_82_part_00
MELSEIGPRGRDSVPLDEEELKALKIKVKKLREMCEFARTNYGPTSSRYNDALRRYQAERQVLLVNGGGTRGGCCCCCCCS